MPVYDEIINDVELGIINLIAAKLAGVFDIIEFQIELDPDKINRFPAVMVATDKMSFENTTQRADTVKPVTHAYLLFKCAKSVNREQFKRHGVLPMVVGVARILNGQDLGLDITPLDPSQATEIVSSELAARDIIMFDLALSWDFEIEEHDFTEEEAADLVTIANTWLLDNVTQITTDIVTPGA